jgi:flagellar secretion chaperone FliS
MSNPMARMYGNTAAYRTVGLEGQIAAATPHGLVTMLFDGALERIELARAALGAADAPRKARALSGALGIVQGLRQSLDHDAGGDLAGRLDALYEYVGRLLLRANVNDDADSLVEAASLLRELRGAWVALPGNA